MVWINFVSHGEIIVHINFGIFTNMADRGKNLKIITEIFFNSLGFGGRLDDEEIFRHILIYYHACQLEKIFRIFNWANFYRDKLEMNFRKICKKAKKSWKKDLLSQNVYVKV